MAQRARYARGDRKLKINVRQLNVWKRAVVLVFDLILGVFCLFSCRKPSSRGHFRDADHSSKGDCHAYSGK